MTLPDHWLASLLDLVFPPRCMGCASRGAWLCPPCRDKLEPVVGPICQRCGRPWPEGGVCPYCRQTFNVLEGLRAGYLFAGPLREGIHRFKYEGERGLAGPLAGLLSPAARSLPWPIDVVVPVPLHPARERQRGYNQSVLLAQALAKVTRAPLDIRSLRRERDTRPQMGLTAAERRANVVGAFAGRPGALAGKRVMLLDDVCTTGSTLEACAQAARQAGAGAVWALVLARAS
jgi:ComF family protein